MSQVELPGSTADSSKATKEFISRPDIMLALGHMGEKKSDHCEPDHIPLPEKGNITFSLNDPDNADLFEQALYILMIVVGYVTSEPGPSMERVCASPELLMGWADELRVYLDINPETGASIDISDTEEALCIAGIGETYEDCCMLVLNKKESTINVSWNIKYRQQDELLPEDMPAGMYIPPLSVTGRYTAPGQNRKNTGFTPPGSPVLQERKQS